MNPRRLAASGGILVLVFATAASAQFSRCSSPALAIPDDTPAGVADAQNLVETVIIGRLEVTVQIAHSWVGDLIVTLNHVDSGTSVVLMDRPGTAGPGLGCEFNDVMVRFSDAAALAVEGECSAVSPAIAGVVRPQQPLSAFAGVALHGTWQLIVSDNLASDVGTLDMWCLEATSATEFCSIPGVAIPDNNPVGVSNDLIISSSQIITDLNVGMQINHTWVGDLVGTLTHVDTGTTVTVLDRPGVPMSMFGCQNNDIVAYLDDEALVPNEGVCAAGPPTMIGTFLPTAPLSAFDGEALAGTWRLTVSDNAASDTGSLVIWCLAPPICTITVCGDCNGDTNITILDALRAAQNAAGLIALVGTEFSSCNVTGVLEPTMGANVDILDSLRIAQFAAGLAVSMACCV